MKKLVIFDLDGTLVNSIYDLADCVNLALSAHSLPKITLQECYSFVGHGIENLIRTSMKSQGGNDELYGKVRSTFDVLYAAHCNDKTVAYDGVAQLLAKLGDKGIRTAVLTNKAHEFVDGILRKCFPEHTFSIAWGNRLGLNRKPDPQGLFALIKEAGCTAEECVFVGDSEVDVHTAKNASIDLVCVDWGFRSREQLLQSGAEIITSDAEELYRALISF
ncbi:MAG: HAD-IA family hydrolase [Ruminococcus sp.]|nr:HAD-IA family hydrolase [Ruminococcus sp.]